MLGAQQTEVVSSRVKGAVVGSWVCMGLFVAQLPTGAGVGVVLVGPGCVECLRLNPK